MPTAPTGGTAGHLAPGALILSVLCLAGSSAGQVPLQPADYQRRSQRDAAALEWQLGLVPQARLSDRQIEAVTALILEARAQEPKGSAEARKRTGASVSPGHMASIQAVQNASWNALGLPARQGSDCQCTPEEAVRLVASAGRLREEGVVSIAAGEARWAPPQVQSLSHFLKNSRLKFDPAKGPPAEMVVALVQTLQAEEEPSRRLLVDLLNLSDSPKAAAALAQRALYDLSPTVRARAVQALKNRSAEAVRGMLLEGFRYPWPVVADHAAETLVALKDQAAVPELERLATEPDPGLPVLRTSSGDRPVVREVVRINHLRNCLLCHAPAFAEHTGISSLVPTPGVDLAGEYYPKEPVGDLQVRADVTYLRQDFSVMQHVPNANPWPALQRFDFLVRERIATAAELDALKNPPATYPQREAVLWALKELRP